DNLCGSMMPSPSKGCCASVLQRRLTLWPPSKPGYSGWQRMAARLQHVNAATNDGSVIDVALKRTEPITLVGKRGCLTTTDEIGPFAVAVVAQLAQASIAFERPLIHRYFDDDGEDGEDGEDESETGDH